MADLLPAERPPEIYRVGCDTYHYGGGKDGLHPICGGGQDARIATFRRADPGHTLTACEACLTILIRKRRG